jgi:hypothetical protein
LVLFLGLFQAIDQRGGGEESHFTCLPTGAAVYQLGQFGTAAKKLKEWDLKP